MSKHPPDKEKKKPGGKGDKAIDTGGALEGKGSDGLPIEQLLHYSPHGVYLIDLTGTIVAVNHAGADHLGTTVEQMIGTVLKDYFPDEVSKKRADKGLEAIQLQKPVIFEDQIEGRWYRNTIIPIIDAEHRITHLAIYGVNTTEYHHAMETLRKTESLYRLHFEHVSDVIYSIDREFKLINISPSVEQVLGYKPEELLGRPFQEMNILAPEYMEQAASNIMRVLGGEKIPSVVYQFIARNGTRRWGELSGAPLIEDGQVVAVVSVARDITHRKEAEETLRESEARFRGLAQLLPETVYEIGEKGNLTFVNQKAFDHFMYTKKDFDRGLNALDMIVPEDRQTAMENIRKIIKGEHVGLTEYTALRKDGSTFPALFHSTPIVRQGKPVGLRGFIIDITERKRAEETLRKSEERFQQIVENAKEWIWEVNAHGLYTYASRVVEDIIGYRPEEIVGRKHFYDFFYPEEKEQLKRAAFEVFAKKESFREFINKNIHKNGSTVWLSTSGIPILDKEGSLLGYRGADADITEHKRAEQSLKESEKRYHELINSITDFIYSHDLKGRFITVNRAAAQTLGYSPEDLIGHPISDFMLPEYRHAFKEEYLVHIKEKGSIDGVTIYVAKDGSKHYIEYRSVLVTQEEMEPFVSGVGRDITEKVLSDLNIRRLDEQLQRAQKMEAIGTLAGGVAHDLNNILSGLVSYPELLLLDLPQDSPLKEPIVTIQQSGKKAAAIVQDMLTLARRGVIATEVTNVNHIINTYLQSPEHEKLREFHPTINMKTDLDIHLLNIIGSPVHLSKTIMNLVSNAAEAMPQGGTINLSTYTKYIDTPIPGYDDIKEGDYVVLTVSDTGIGISSEERDRIFEPFYTKKVMGRSGTGLGMAVVWGTVKDHKGYIDIQSTPGKGTTFTLYFPVIRKEIGEQEQALPMEEYMGKGESILVVDDVEEQRDIASRILTKLGYAVASVESGEEAVDYMKDNAADLLILDMIMEPGIDGLETYKKIITSCPHQKAIIASGFSETELVKEAQRLGAGQYIKKPYTLEKIGIAVKEELGK